MNNIELITEFRECEKKVKDLISNFEKDNIISAGTVEIMKKEIFEKKEKAVIQLHGGPFNQRTINKNGKPTLVYRVKINGKQIEKIDYKDFIDKVATEYGLTEEGEDKTSFTLDQVFKLALDKKIKQDNISDNTVDKYEHEYERYIDDTMRNKLIINITADDLMEYTQALTKSMHLKKKAFLSYKGVLNIIFEYATNKLRIISPNPVLEIDNKKYLKNCDTRKPRPEEKIHSQKDVMRLFNECERRKSLPRYKGYCANAFVCQLAILTGMRVAELCSLKESDIHEDYIHIHSQQLLNRRKGNRHFEDVPYTKDERGIENGGRPFPLAPIAGLLEENKAAKEVLGLTSEYVFCTLDNKQIKTTGYQPFLRRMCKSLGLRHTGNHALRMSYNSNELAKNGLSTIYRAALIGNSPTVNDNHYTHSPLEIIEETADLLPTYEDMKKTVSHP